MEIGKRYRFKNELDDKRFPFGYSRGMFIGYTKAYWPLFALNVEKGTTCIVNAKDDNFELVEKDRKIMENKEKIEKRREKNEEK